MKQETVRRAGGTKPPVTKKPTVEASSAPTIAAVETKRVVKRKLKDEALEPAVYTTINNKGGSWLKIRTSGLTYFDKEKNQVRAIRYCPGEQSIYIDEQSGQSTTEHVVLQDKLLHVATHQPNLRAFMDSHPDNQANGGRVFFKVQKEAKSEKIIADEFLVHDAITLIKDKPINDLLPLAMALNINTDQQNIDIKRELVLMAKRSPQKVLDMFGNPLVEARSTVKQGFDFQIVKDVSGAVVWYDTGKMIVSVPVGQDRIETLTRYVMTDQGASVLAEIERQLDEIA